MSEMTELAPAETTPAAAEDKPKRRIWPLLAWGAVAAVIVTAGTVAALGTTGALLAGGCTAGAVAAGAVVWRLPQLRRHFARPRGASRMRSVQSRTRRMTLGGGGRKGKLAGLGLGSGRKGKLLSGGTGRKGKPLALGSGRARGRSPGTAGSGRAGKGRGGGKSLLGKARRAGGRLLPGKPGRMFRGTGRKAGAGSGGPGAKPRGGPVRRAVRRLLPGAGKRVAAGKPASGKKASAPRRAAGIAGTAALLPFAGALAGTRKLRTRIRRRRGKNAPPPAEDNPPAKTQDPPPPKQPPARQPGLPLAPSQADHPRRRINPVAHQVNMAAEAIEQGIGSFEPENVDDLGRFLYSLPTVYEALAGALQRVAERFADEYPLHPAVAEHIREMASGAAGQQEYATEAHQIFTTTHQDDLERLDNPRPGEEFMDVSNQ